MRSILLGTLLFFSLPLMSKTLTVQVTQFPANHPFDQPVFLAGSINGWNPADESFQLTLNNDQTYSITLEGEGAVSFKFTRGGWDKVEKGNGCAEIGNRSFTFGADTVYSASVINWADVCSGGNSPSSTATENVSIMDEAFNMPQFGRTRRIWIYLPTDYETSGISYPVLYMHDGQNLFDTSTSFAGEWQIDESLNALIKAGAPAAIVVGVENGGTYRIAEYTPWGNPNYGGGDGEKYVDFLVETLKPYIDQNYRTLPGRENTGIAGSSLGGLVSFYAGLKHQDVFSKIGIFSPSFWFSDSSYTFARETEKQFDLQMYFVAGGKEGTDNEVVVACENMIDTLLQSGFTASEMHLSTNPDGAHSEWFWRSEFPACYRWFWGIETLKNDLQQIQLELFPNPAVDSVTLQIYNLNQAYQVKILNANGVTVYQEKQHENKVVISTQSFPDGVYLFQCHNELFSVTRKLLIGSK